VSECVGVHVVGFTIMMYGLGSALGSFVTGKLLALEMKALLELGGLVLHLAIMLFLVIWEREPILLLLLFLGALWGICDGTWVTSCSSKCVILLDIYIAMCISSRKFADRFSIEVSPYEH